MTPLLWAAIACCAGLLAGFRMTLGPVAIAALACSPALLFVLRSRAVMPLALTAAGLVAGTLRSSAAASDCRERLGEGERVRIVAAATSLPVEGQTGVMHAASLIAGATACADVAIRVRAAPAQQAQLFAAALDGPAAVELHGRWLPHARRNGWPRAPQFAGMLLVDSVQRGAGDAGAASLARLRITQQARLRTLLPERWPLAEAMLLAQKSGLAPETRSRWVAAGLVHLLAISGMHVGMIAAGVIALARVAGLSRRRARRVALVVTAGYVLFLGAPSAALRALLQFGLLIGALELQRPAEPFTALAAAALCILFIEPLALLDPGFQLSFAGMIGLIAWRRPISELLPARTPALLRDGIAAGIAASALTTPLAALHFGTASWIGIPASIVAVPVLGAAVALVLAALLLCALTGADAGLHAWPADISLRTLEAVASAAAAVPGGHGYLGTPTVLYALLACAAAVLLRARLRAHAVPAATPAARTGLEQRRAQALRVATLAAAAVVVLSWAPLLLRSHAQQLEIHVIDVGQGDAIAIRSPAGRWLLVDTGPRTPRFDAGRDRVVPYLLRRGARRIDALVLTHPDADHIGGAEAVLDVFDIGLVIDPGFAAGKDMFIDLLVAAQRTDRRWVAGRAGQRFVVDGVEITLLYPVPQLDGARDANDNSVVFRLAFGAFAALFTGDAPQVVEDEIVARHGAALRAAVLKVGHHGSRTSTGDRLLGTAQPTIALISAGRNNRYGHPNPGVLQRLEAHGVRVVRTDERGSFVVRARRDGRAEVLAR